MEGLPSGYRPNVGVCLINSDNQVFVASRLNVPGAWQMPQGGIEDGEEPKSAAIRELQEETGVVSAEIIAEVPKWLTYDFPPAVKAKVNRLWGGEWHGQAQKWFLMRLTEDDSEINLANGEADPEFADWKWSSPEEVIVEKALIGVWKMAFCSMFCCGKGLDRKEGKKQPTWRIFSLKELHAATNNFNYDNKLGEGGFGSVYWGQLWDGSQIAVKRLKVWSNKAEMEFSVEVEILARVRHKNLLSLRGYCAEGQERLIVYDYMPNLSLLSHLHGQHSAECLLDWSRRMNIAIGSAEGISYLHHHATPHIIHRDIKASNVLLSSDFQAQVADFGFAKLIPDGATHVTTRVKGTLGYLAPEYAMLGKASESCDVYSFGILLLELASGKKPIEKLNATMKRTITDWALPLACEKKFSEIADPRLNGKFVETELKRVVLVGLICADSRPEKRPTMLEVVELLKGESKEKLAELENDELFKKPVPTDCNDGKPATEEHSDFISEEKDTQQELKKTASGEAHSE